MTKWQPIETAPKDGTKVLLYGTYQWEDYFLQQDKGTVIGFWNDVTFFDVHFWQLISNNPYHDRCQPSHWMPLPEGPE